MQLQCLPKLHGDRNSGNKSPTEEAGFQNPSQIVKEAVTFPEKRGASRNVLELEQSVLIHGTKSPVAINQYVNGVE
jgi:hypothetical protein